MPDIAISYPPTFPTERYLLKDLEQTAEFISEEFGLEYDDFEELLDAFGITLQVEGMSGERIGAYILLHVEGLVEKIDSDEVRVSVADANGNELEVNLPTKGMQEVTVSGFQQRPRRRRRRRNPDFSGLVDEYVEPRTRTHVALLAWVNKHAKNAREARALLDAVMFAGPENITDELAKRALRR